MTLSRPSLALILGKLTIRMTSLFFFSKAMLSKSLSVCLSISTYPSCWKFAYIQSFPEKGDNSIPANYPFIELISCLSKAFESVLNMKKMRHLSAHNLVSDCQHGFRIGRFTGDLLAFLTES